MQQDVLLTDPAAFGGDAALRDYVVRAYGTDRKSINILMALGIAFWGWIMLVPYNILGQTYRGLAFLAPFLAARVLAGGRTTSPAGIASIAVFLAAWVDTNMILTRYARVARARLERLAESPALDTDCTLEKGLLLHKVLGDRAGGIDEFRNALKMEGGDSTLWNLAGISLCRCGAYRDSLLAFGRASSAPPYLARIVKTFRTKAERIAAMGKA
ncbi:MAG: hypothetical protein HPY55_06265 [Firmicutes bacterium]|nr:hypothetical protein [Bacillota bacterium]